MNGVTQRSLLSRVSVGTLAVLCGVLGLLQYRWIGALTDAENARMHETLRTRLSALSRTFNQEIASAAADLEPPQARIEDQGLESAYSAHFTEWKKAHERVFSRIALAVPEAGGPNQGDATGDNDGHTLRLLNLNLNTNEFAPSEWPAEWNSVRARLTRGRRFEGGPDAREQTPLLLEIPRFDGERRDPEWLLLEVNPDYLRMVLLPQLMTVYLGENGRLDYDAQLVESSGGKRVIYDSAPGVSGTADASVSMLEIGPAFFGGRGGRGGRRGPPERGGPSFASGRPPPGEPPGQGSLTLSIRHRAGSLEALVEQTRWRNLGVSGGLLLLIVATGLMLVHLSRQAEKLAELQFNFVAGVSHELRTPLTVIRTAAFNLKSRLASRPEQVERYGALIEAESEKLTQLLDQVLRFASSQAGHVIRELHPLAIAALIERELRIEGVGLTVAKKLAPDLPVVLADGVALRQALQNLVDNALKYGVEGQNWIGIFASRVSGDNGDAVEIRVADRGPGIPADEQRHIFEPFYRGRHAVQDQVHGTGLGLDLVRKIVEAHGGTIRVESEPMVRTEFIVRLPAAPAEFQNEFAHPAG